MKTYMDLEVWQMAAELNELLAAERGLSRGRNGLAGQIRSAALSVASNIAEGWGRRSDAEFHHFAAIAHGSCIEVQAQLRLAYRAGHIQVIRFQALIDLAMRIGWMIASLKRRLRPPP